MPNTLEPRVSYTTFYHSWHETIKKLPKDQGYDLVLAINEYCFYGIEPELQFPLDVIFMSIKPAIDSSVNKKINGKKGGDQGGGGAPNGNSNASGKIDSSPKVEPKQDNSKPEENNSNEGAKPKQNNSKLDENNSKTIPMNMSTNMDTSMSTHTHMGACACEKNSSGHTGQDPPMQKHRYPKIDWQMLYEEIIAAGFPDPGGAFRLNVRGKDLLEAVNGLTFDEIIAAIRNYGEMKKLPGTWWNTNPDFVSWARNNITRFLPQNFNLAEYSGDTGKEEVQAQEEHREMMRKRYLEEGTG